MKKIFKLVLIFGVILAVLLLFFKLGSNSSPYTGRVIYSVVDSGVPSSPSNLQAILV